MKSDHFLGMNLVFAWSLFLSFCKHRLIFCSETLQSVFLRMQSLALLLSLAVRTTDKSQRELDVVSAAPPGWAENVFLCQQFYSTKVSIFLLSETKRSLHLGKLNHSKDLTYCNTFFTDITAIKQKDTGKQYFHSVLIYALSPINFEHWKRQEDIVRKHASCTFSSKTSLWEVIQKWLLP